jgi:predicted  nucleic acid-binding Zn-ribbon protein
MPGSDLTERIKIQEKALQELADRLEKREHAFEEEMQDILEELKALKLFLSRTIPDFRKQYPEIRKKLKAA